MQRTAAAGNDCRQISPSQTIVEYKYSAVVLERIVSARHNRFRFSTVNKFYGGKLSFVRRGYRHALTVYLAQLGIVDTRAYSIVARCSFISADVDRAGCCIWLHLPRVQSGAMLAIRIFSRKTHAVCLHVDKFRTSLLFRQKQ